MGENIYFQYRKRAATHNDKLNSREGAAECLGISESSLAHYELGITKNIPVDVVVMMAELYNAPELKNHYCKAECPIGCCIPVATEEASISQATVHLLESLDPDNLREQKKQVLKISQDGKVSPQEAQRLSEVLESLDKISEALSELRILAEKNAERGEGK